MPAAVSRNAYDREAMSDLELGVPSAWYGQPQALAQHAAVWLRCHPKEPTPPFGFRRVARAPTDSVLTAHERGCKRQQLHHPCPRA
eukprot:89285-Chlamydomonas_euryale.AAC.9